MHLLQNFFSRFICLNRDATKGKKKICLLGGSELFLNLYECCLESILALLVHCCLSAPFFSSQKAIHRFSKWCVGTFVNVLKYEWDFKNTKLLRKTLNYCTRIDETGKPYSDIYVIYTQTFMPCIYKCASISAYIHLLHIHCKIC